MATVSGAAKVSVKEIDLSQRVPGFPGVYGGIVADLVMGDTENPTLVGSEAQFLKRYTPDARLEVGYSLGYFSGLAFLQKANALWMNRPRRAASLFAGSTVKIHDSVSENVAWDVGEDEASNRPWSDTGDEALAISAANVGAWPNLGFGYRLWQQRDQEEIVLGEDSLQLSISDPTKAQGVLDDKLSITAAFGSAGNLVLNLENNPECIGSEEISTIEVVSDVTVEAGYAGKYFTFNTAEVQYYVWFTVEGEGEDPNLSNPVGIEVALMLNQTAAEIATAIGNAIIAIPGMACDVVIDATVINITNKDIGSVEASLDGLGDKSTSFIFNTLQEGLDNVVLLSPVLDGILTVGIIDEYTLQLEIVEALLISPLFDEVIAQIPTEIWTLGTGSDSVTLMGGTDGIDTIKTVQHWVTGEPVRLVLMNPQEDDVVPEGLELNKIYFTIENSQNSIKLALTQSNAFNDTFVHFTDKGIGTMRVVPIKEVEEKGAFLLEVYRVGNENYPIESFICSRVETATNAQGANIFVTNKLNTSEYIRGYSNPLVLGAPKPQVKVLYLAAGEDGDPCTDGNMMIAADKFLNKETYDITCFMDGGWATPAYQKHMEYICAKRFNSVALLSTPFDKEESANYLNDLVDYRMNILNLNSSFAALYTPHVKIYDKFTDQELFVSPDGYAGAAISWSAYNYELWYPPAGFRRGMVNVLDVARRFEQPEMDTLYNKGMNPIRFISGKGICIWGQKTLLASATALNRLNVRLMLMVIEPAIQIALEDYLFEINDVGSRIMVKKMIDDYMSGIRGRKGVYNWETKCDDDNNSADDIDNHVMNVDLYVWPTKSTEYIPFSVVIMRTGVSLSLAA